MTTLKEYVKQKEFCGAFDKFPEGDTFLDLDKTTVEEAESQFLNQAGKPKIQYLLKTGDKEYVAGKQIMSRIKELAEKGCSKLRITRTGTTKEDTKYTVVAVNL